MARQKSVTPATVFSATVRAALEHVADPQWLGRHSPLATPYFLGQQSSGNIYPTGERERGLRLQITIREAAAERVEVEREGDGLVVHLALAVRGSRDRGQDARGAR